MMCFVFQRIYDEDEDARNKKCIQYTHKQGGNTLYYALKVFDKTTVTFVVS